jgi:hypothetical protein
MSKFSTYLMLFVIGVCGGPKKVKLSRGDIPTTSGPSTTDPKQRRQRSALKEQVRSAPSIYYDVIELKPDNSLPEKRLETVELPRLDGTAGPWVLGVGEHSITVELFHKNSPNSVSRHKFYILSSSDNLSQGVAPERLVVQQRFWAEENLVQYASLIMGAIDKIISKRNVDSDSSVLPPCWRNKSFIEGVKESVTRVLRYASVLYDEHEDSRKRLDELISETEITLGILTSKDNTTDARSLLDTLRARLDTLRANDNPNTDCSRSSDSRPEVEVIPPNPEDGSPRYQTSGSSNTCAYLEAMD